MLIHPAPMSCCAADGCHFVSTCNSIGRWALLLKSAHSASPPLPPSKHRFLHAMLTQPAPPCHAVQLTSVTLTAFNSSCSLQGWRARPCAVLLSYPCMSVVVLNWYPPCRYPPCLSCLVLLHPAMHCSVVDKCVTDGYSASCGALLLESAHSAAPPPPTHPPSARQAHKPGCLADSACAAMPCIAV